MTIYLACFMRLKFYSLVLHIPQYGSSYTESANEEIPFTDLAEDVEDIYDQLAHEKCIEIPRIVLK